MIRSKGKSDLTALATVRPPMPLSKIPIGAWAVFFIVKGFKDTKITGLF
jgi:hypothetical protein